MRWESHLQHLYMDDFHWHVRLRKDKPHFCWPKPVFLSRLMHLERRVRLGNPTIQRPKAAWGQQEITSLRMIPTMAFCLTYILAFNLAYILTFYLSFYLAFYLTYMLTFYLAFKLTYILTFCLAYMLAFYLTYILALCLPIICYVI